MHLRRALLLFALVLGFAAVAASLSPPPDDRDDGATAPAPPPAREPDRAARPAAARFRTAASGEPRRRTVKAGERAVVTVEVDAPGQVAIEGLGLLQPAVPGTPAVFDVLAPKAAHYEVTFSPVGGRPRRVGVLEVEAPAA